MTASVAFAASPLENDDIKISGLEGQVSLVTSWDNPNAWSLEDETDIVKVISTELFNSQNRKIKNTSIDSDITISIHIPEAYRSGYEDSDYSVVVFKGTAVRERIQVTKEADWLTFSWNTIEDFGIVVKGANNGESGALTLVGQSRHTIEAVDFKRLFRILGIIAIVCIPFMTIVSWVKVKKDMQEEAEAARLQQEEEDEK